VPALERASAAGHGSRQALVYRNPLAQAASYFRYCLEHKSPAYNRLAGGPLVGMPFRDYLFDSALPSTPSNSSPSRRWPRDIPA